MKKMDRKGFTLIELLAVIVILAIIMVIAVPQILNVIDSSRESAWKSNVKLIAEGIELGKTLTDTNMTTSTFDINTVCAGTEAKDVTSDLQTVADISSDDTTVTCSATQKGVITVAGKGQFKTQKTATVDCSTGSCSISYPKGE